MTELTEILHQREPISPEQADRITTSWPVSVRSPIATDDQCEEIARSLSVLTQEARPSWIMARVASLLSQYYAADVPAAAVAIMAEDWLEALREYPQWAVTKAVRWWKSEANPDRKRRPLEGDIAARAKMEMGLVRVAEMRVQRFWGGERPYIPEPTPEAEIPRPITDEEREASRQRIAEYVKQAGFATQRANPEGQA